jgi:hypothetical protein
MPNVDMPILEAPVPSASTLDQQDEDFLRELTNYNYETNSHDAKTEQTAYGNYNGQFIIQFLLLTFVSVSCVKNRNRSKLNSILNEFLLRMTTFWNFRF